jgi:hypothetical protein
MSKRAGDRFGRLVVVEKSSERRSGRLAWLCRCDCGGTAIVATGNLHDGPGAVRSCGCLRDESPRGRFTKKRPGDRFERLVLVERVENNKWGNPRWRARCDCGKELVVVSTNLNRTKKNTSSCGCLRRERQASKNPLLSDFNEAIRQRYKLSRSGKKHPWSLTIDEYRAIVSGNCRYCGAAPSMLTKVVGVLKNGIDRVDSKRGYHADNCVPCCTKCNLMKGSLSVSEFIEQVARIHAHTKTKDL